MFLIHSLCIDKKDEINKFSVKMNDANWFNHFSRGTFQKPNLVWVNFTETSKTQ